MPWSSPRSSGCRATDWIIDPKMLPMPTPAPRAPSPTPSARPIAFPAFSTLPDVAARTVPITGSSLVLGLDGRADVDGGQGSEDERLDTDDDNDLEEIEGGRKDQDWGQEQRLEDEDQSDEGEDQDVSCEHVREETNAQRDQAHELAQHFERNDQGQERLGRLRDPALEVTNRPVPADALNVREDEGQEGERERDRERRRRGVDPPDRKAVPGLSGQRKGDEADEVDDEDEEQQARHVGEPAPDRLRGQSLLGDLGLRDLVDLLTDRLPGGGLDANAKAHEEDAEGHRQHGADEQVDDGLVDRQVERAEMDRDPLVQLELFRRVELAAGEGCARRDQREGREEEECPLHTGGFPKYVTSDSRSSTVYANA